MKMTLPMIVMKVIIIDNREDNDIKSDVLIWWWWHWWKWHWWFDSDSNDSDESDNNSDDNDIKGDCNAHDNYEILWWLSIMLSMTKKKVTMIIISYATWTSLYKGVIKNGWLLQGASPSRVQDWSSQWTVVLHRFVLDKICLNENVQK